MLKSLHIQNFKSHKDTNLPLTNLNILAGQNGVGKSSVIQALLLLRQTHQKNRLHHGLDLNKPLCDIGSAADALYERSEEDFIAFGLERQTASGELQSCRWQFAVELPKMTAQFLYASKKDTTADIDYDFSLFNNNFQYLSANRLPPNNDGYESDDYAIEVMQQISIVKGQGELIAHFLDFYGEKKIEPSLLHPNSKPYEKDLMSQVGLWEREISKNVNIHVERQSSGKFDIKYSFDLEKNHPTNKFRAENVGFGVSYVLPIIVALLSAEEDALIIIENPEAHLHPQAQSKLSELICIAAQAGRQIIVETHSDHIINGILVQAKKHSNTENYC